MIAAQSKLEHETCLADDRKPPPSGSWEDISEKVGPFLNLVTRTLVQQVETFHPLIREPIAHALENQGKQLRPTLVALSAESLGDWDDGHVQLAVIIEMVHLATLVHDDIMDQAVIRRRRPTLAANWGNQIAVLAGDCLFAQSLKLASEFPTTEICRSVASAAKTVCSGEIIQTDKRNFSALTRHEYYEVLQMKTGELFALSCEQGARLGGATSYQCQALRQFGMDLGTAYQIYDDCIDLFSNERNVGKSLGTDLEGGKITLPLILVMERASESDKRLLDSMLLDWNDEFFERVEKMLVQYESLELARRIVLDKLDSSRERLNAALPETGALNCMNQILDYLAYQTMQLGMEPV